jgi:hypothetical protein
MADVTEGRDQTGAKRAHGLLAVVFGMVIGGRD